MKQSEMRKVAAQAARSELRKRELEPTLGSAEHILDDLARSEPDLIASMWWKGASDNQIKLFRREWRGWLRLNPCPVTKFLVWIEPYDAVDIIEALNAQGAAEQFAAIYIIDADGEDAEVRNLTTREEVAIRIYPTAAD